MTIQGRFVSELMFIARKLKQNEQPGATVFVNLWHNPLTIYEAMDVAERFNACEPAALEGEAVASVSGADGRKLAEIVRMPSALGESQWTGVQFAQTWALRAAVMLGNGKLAVPGKQPTEVKLCALGELGALGPDRKRVHEGFTVSATDWSPYPGFWNHDATRVVGMAQKPNSYLSVWAESPRGGDYGPRRLWPRAGRILLVERVRTTTHRVLAVRFDEEVLGNTWWALKADLAPMQEKALLLWLNSTPNILLMLSRRVTTQGPWMKIKQPQWAAMPVLDVRALDEDTLSQLAAAYDTLCDRELKALAKLDTDPVRAEIDDAIRLALDLPDMKPLRSLLAREPGLTGKGLSPKPGQTGLFGDEEPETQPVQMQLFL